MKPISLNNEPETPTEPEIAIAFTSVIAAITARNRKHPGKTSKSNVSRQSPNSGRRKRAPQDPCGIQAPDRREVRDAILYHQPRRQGCRSLSLRGVAEAGREVFTALEFQSRQEEFPETHQLLRPAGGDGRARPVADATVAAGIGGDQGRGGSDGLSDLPRSAQPGNAAQRGTDSV